MGGTEDQWTRLHYRRKILQLAACLRAATRGQPPAMLALAEVESVRVQQDLRRALGWHDLVITDELVPDAGLEGLSVALMLDGAIFDLDTLRAHSVVLDPRSEARDLLEVRIRMQGSTRDVVFMVAHWPTRRIDADDTRRREYSTRLRERLDAIARDDAEATEPTPCVVVGDFNDGPDDPSVRDALRSTTSSAAVAAEVERAGVVGAPLLNGCADLRFSDDGQPGGSCYADGWCIHDQVLLSWGALREPARLRYVADSARAVRFPPLEGGAVVMTDAQGRPRPFDELRAEGVSDHFPLFFELDLQVG